VPTHGGSPAPAGRVFSLSARRGVRSGPAALPGATTGVARGAGGGRLIDAAALRYAAFVVLVGQARTFYCPTHVPAMGTVLPVLQRDLDELRALGERPRCAVCGRQLGTAQGGAD